jgi:hypothetical protein
LPENPARRSESAHLGAELPRTVQFEEQNASQLVQFFLPEMINDN